MGLSAVSWLSVRLLVKVAKGVLSLKMKKQPWNIGDVYAYRISSDLAKEFGLIGRYFLLQKIGEIPYSPRIMAPIVYVKITKDERIPTTIEEFNQLEFVQIKTTLYENRFCPVDFSRLEEDIAEKSKLVYTVDEYGHLPQFRALLVPSVGKCVPPDLIYVSCFPDAAPPKNEFIPHSDLNLRMIFCKKDCTLLDRILSETYHAYNLRTSKLYQNKDTFHAAHQVTESHGLECLPDWLRSCLNKDNGTS